MLLLTAGRVQSVSVAEERLNIFWEGGTLGRILWVKNPRQLSSAKKQASQWLPYSRRPRATCVNIGSRGTWSDHLSGMGTPLTWQRPSRSCICDTPLHLSALIWGGFENSWQSRKADTPTRLWPRSDWCDGEEVRSGWTMQKLLSTHVLASVQLDVPASVQLASPIHYDGSSTGGFEYHRFQRCFRFCSQLPKAADQLLI